MADTSYYRRRTLITREFAVESRVPPDVLVVWLQRYVGRRRGYLVSSAGPLYRGQVSHRGFDLQRHVNYRNPVFDPTVTGEFRPHSEGTTAHIAVKVSGLGIAVAVAAVVFGFSVGLLGGLGLVPVIDSETGEELDLIWLLLAGPFIALSMIVAMFLFLEAGARQAHRDLTQILTGGEPGPSERWPEPGTPRGGR